MISPDRPSGPDIATRQNTIETVRRQAACRAAYDLAKRWAGLGACGALLLAFVSPLTVILAPGVSNTVAAIGGLWLVASRFAFDPRRAMWQRIGATLQDEFDWYSIGVRTEMGASQVILPEQKARLLRTTDISRFRDWYATNPHDAWPAAPLRCQCQTASWSSRLHSIWVYALTVVVILSLGAQVLVCTAQEASVPEFLGLVILPSAAFYLTVLDSIQKHVSARKQRTAIVGATTAWFAHASEANGIALLSTNQARLFEMRARGPLIPSVVYRAFRAPLERDMRDAAALGLP